MADIAAAGGARRCDVVGGGRLHRGRRCRPGPDPAGRPGLVQALRSALRRPRDRRCTRPCWCAPADGGPTCATTPAAARPRARRSRTSRPPRPPRYAAEAVGAGRAGAGRPRRAAPQRRARPTTPVATAVRRLAGKETAALVDDVLAEGGSPALRVLTMATLARLRSRWARGDRRLEPADAAARAARPARQAGAGRDDDRGPGRRRRHAARPARRAGPAGRRR